MCSCCLATSIFKMAEGKVKAFEVPFSDGSNKDSNLQEAFLQYRKKKQDELRARVHSEQLSMAERREPARMEGLRTKFLQTAMNYIGIPYAKRYHEPESPTHHSKLFLDCCGLVRRAVVDLKEEFGFTIGPWNQAYMFDTLPVALSGPKEMKPGDLVFVSAIYYSPKAKKQRHNMVHVEIWMGDGEKTLGARWQKKSVEVHDSYKFVSKSYHSMEYHFRSIDTWLTGECKSHCLEHPWTVRKFDPSKHSVFALQSQDEDAECCSAYAEQQEHTRGEQLSGAPLIGEASDPVTSSSCVEPQVAGVGLSGVEHDTASVKVHKGQRSKLARSFVICGGNAAPLVEQALLTRGWMKLEDKSSLSFTLKWTEVKKQIDFKNFREGDQMVNHFPNINLLTTKIGLLESLRNYTKIHRPKMRMDNFFPLTYRMDVRTEKEEFVRNYTEGELWICKPTGANQGKGIFLVRELQHLLEKLESDQTHQSLTSRPTARIVQRYISDPLLLTGRKFDIRVYMLVLAAKPWLVLYRSGYVRLCCESYVGSSDNLSVHLTNQYQQKKNPLYSELKEDTVWDFDKFQQCLSREHGLGPDWVQATLRRRMVSIMTTCFNSIRHKLTHAIGYFDLLGFDFMLDSQFNLWLIEVNINPALHTNCDTLAQVSPSTLGETLDIAIEVFDKCRRNKPLLPITSLKNFSIIVS